MNAARRGMTYWSWIFLESLGLGAAVVLCALVVRILFGRTSLSVMGVLQVVVWIGILGELMCMCAIYLTWFRVQLPVLISLNCRRKEIFWSLESARLLFCVVYGGVSAVLMQGTGIIPGGWEHFWRVWILAGILFGVCTSLGEFNGCLFYLFGRKMALLAAVEFGILGGIAGGGLGANIENGAIHLYEGSFQLPAWGMAAAAGGLILYLLGVFASGRILRKAEVRM